MKGDIALAGLVVGMFIVIAVILLPQTINMVVFNNATIHNYTYNYFNLSNISADNITSGTLDDMRLSLNISVLPGALQDINNTKANATQINTLQQYIDELNDLKLNKTGSLSQTGVTINSTNVTQPFNLINVTDNIFMLNGTKICLISNCSRYIMANDTGVLIQG